jgi:hypothetical protein
MKISIDLENCYGIKSLKHEFDFTNCNTFLIYASNGAMKTSLAKVFDDLSKSETPSDKIYPNRTTTCNVSDDNGIPLNPLHIFVTFNYDGEYNPREFPHYLLIRNYEMNMKPFIKTLIIQRIFYYLRRRYIWDKRNVESHLLDAF